MPLGRSLPGEAPTPAPTEVTWTLEPEEELRMEIEGRGPEHKVTVRVSLEKHGIVCSTTVSARADSMFL